MTFSVLVVDDHAAWRERVCLEVQRGARWLETATQNREVTPSPIGLYLAKLL